MPRTRLFAARFFAAGLGLVSLTASPLLAQNDMTPALGKLSEWSDAPVKPAPPVLFTTLGSYRDDAGTRLVDVRSNADANGDGTPDQGMLSLSCNGGDAVGGSFSIGQSVAAKGKAKQAGEASPLAAGKSYRARWVGAADGASRRIMLSAGQADVCA